MPITRWASRRIAEISACRLRSCTSFASAGFAFSRITRTSLARLSDAGIEVVERLPCEAAPTPHSLAYLRAKKEKMGHALSLGQHERTGYPNHSQDRFEFASVETAIRELRAGRMIVVIDDEDRENEGDLTMAAELVTPEAINFMATHGRGLICLAMTGERLDELDLARDGAGQHRAPRHCVYDLDRRERPRRHHRHFGPRSGANDPGRRGRRQLSG